MEKETTNSRFAGMMLKRPSFAQRQTVPVRLVFRGDGRIVNESLQAVSIYIY